MARYLYTLLLVLVLISCSKKKPAYKTFNPTTDSLSIYFDMANNEKLTVLKRKEFTQKAFSIVMNQPNDSMHRVYLLRVANRYFNMGEPQGYENTVRILLEKSKKTNDTTYIAKAYSYLGDYFGVIGSLDSAYTYYFKAEKMFIALHDHSNLARTRLNKANLQYDQSDFLGAEIAIFNGLRVIKKNEAKDLIFDSYNLLGLIYNDLEEYDKALEYNKKAYLSIKENEESSLKQYRAMSLNNTGLVYLNSTNKCNF